MDADVIIVGGSVHSFVRDRSTQCYVERVSEQISQRELRNDSGRIMRALDDGESFIINRNGVPVGELRPLRRQRFISAAAAVAMFHDAPRVDLAALRRDLDINADQDIPDRV